MRVGDPRAQNIDVCVCSLCAWVTHAHVRVGESRARILYTKMPPGPIKLGPGWAGHQLGEVVEVACCLN